MNRLSLVTLITAFAVTVFAGGAYFVLRPEAAPPQTTLLEGAQLIRPHSPILGRNDAPVTIVEFFDPSCESCRAMFPVVQQILSAYPSQVRVVMRYAAFHQGSDEAVRILETARLQGLFEPVLEALVESQADWATHGAPQLDKAWSAAAQVGLNVDRARREKDLPSISAILAQDAADITALGVRQTPTFYVNGAPLEELGPQQLNDMVKREVDKL